jgi:hypothetical protein
MNSRHEKPWTIGDRRTAIADTLTDPLGRRIDLTGCTVAFRMVDNAGATQVDDAAGEVDSVDGDVSYTFAAGDHAGIADGDRSWYCWIVTNTATGRVDTYPYDGRTFSILWHEAE